MEKIIQFKKAVKDVIKVKLAVCGVSNSGKTYSALRLAKGLVGAEGKIAFVDTEHNSACLYASLFDFDVVNMNPPYHPLKFTQSIDAAINQSYDVVILDSISPEWAGDGGVLDIKGSLDERGGNQFSNWRKPTELHNKFIDKILSAPIHIICCMRSKQDYMMIQDSKGKTVPKKVGLAPIQREGIEYEFSLVFDIALNHRAKVEKDRTQVFKDIEEDFLITEDTGKLIRDWLAQK